MVSSNEDPPFVGKERHELVDSLLGFYDDVVSHDQRYEARAHAVLTK